MIKIEGLTKSYGERQVFKGISLSVQAGEFLVVLGPSGAGKSTLLRCVNGLVHADAGRDRDRRRGVSTPSEAGGASGSGRSR